MKALTTCKAQHTYLMGMRSLLTTNHALKLMQELKAGVEAMPNDVEPTPLDHPLAAFSGDPAKSVLGVVKVDWEDILNPRMK